MDSLSADDAWVPSLRPLGRVASSCARPAPVGAGDSVALVPPGAAAPSELRWASEGVAPLPPGLVLGPAQEAFAAAADGLADEPPASLLAARAVHERGLLDLRLGALRRQTRRERRRKRRRGGWGGGFWAGRGDDEESSGSGSDASSSGEEEGEEDDDDEGERAAARSPLGLFSPLSQKSARRGRSRLGPGGGASGEAAAPAARRLPVALAPSLLVARPGRDPQREVELLLLRERDEWGGERGIPASAGHGRLGSASGPDPAGGGGDARRALFPPCLTCSAPLPTRQTPRQLALLPPLSAADASLAPGSVVRAVVRTMHELGIVGWRVERGEESGDAGEGERVAVGGGWEKAGSMGARGDAAASFPCSRALPPSQTSFAPRSSAPFAAAFRRDPLLSARTVLPRSPTTDLCCVSGGGGRRAHVALQDGRICEARFDVAPRGGGAAAGAPPLGPRPAELFSAVAWRPPARWSERIAARLAGRAGAEGEPRVPFAPSPADPSAPLLPARRSSAAPRTLLAPALEPRSLVVSAAGAAAVADLRAPAAGGVALEGVWAAPPGGPAAGALRGVGAGLGFSEGRDADRCGEITALAAREGAPFAAVAAEGGVVRLLDVRSPARPLAAWDLSLLARPTWGWRAGLGGGPKGHAAVVDRLVMFAGGAAGAPAPLPRLVAVVEGGAPLGARGWLLEAEAGPAPWWGPGGLGVDVDRRTGKGSGGIEDDWQDEGGEDGEGGGGGSGEGGARGSSLPPSSQGGSLPGSRLVVTWRPVRPLDLDPLGPVPLFDARANRRAEQGAGAGGWAPFPPSDVAGSSASSPPDSALPPLPPFAPPLPSSAALHRGRDTSLPSAPEDLLDGLAVLPFALVDLARAPEGEVAAQAGSFPAASSSHVLLRLSRAGRLAIDELRDPEEGGEEGETAFGVRRYGSPPRLEDPAALSGSTAFDGSTLSLALSGSAALGGSALSSTLSGSAALGGSALSSTLSGSAALGGSALSSTLSGSAALATSAPSSLPSPSSPSSVALPVTARVVEALMRRVDGEAGGIGKGEAMADVRARSHRDASTSASALPLPPAAPSRASARCDLRRLACLLRELRCPTTPSELWAAFRYGRALPAALPLAPRRARLPGAAEAAGGGVREWAPERTAGRLLGIAKGVEDALDALVNPPPTDEAQAPALGLPPSLPALFAPPERPAAADLGLPPAALEALRAADAKLHSWSRAPSGPALRQRGKRPPRPGDAEGDDASGGRAPEVVAASPPAWFVEAAAALAEGACAAEAGFAAPVPLARVLRHRVPPPAARGEAEAAPWDRGVSPGAAGPDRSAGLALLFAPLGGSFPFAWPEGEAARDLAGGAAPKGALPASALPPGAPPPSDAAALAAFAADWEEDDWETK